jgi:hypothetical protein
VQGEREDPVLGGGLEHRNAVGAGGVDDDLAGPEATGRGEPANEAGQRVVRDGEQCEVGAGHDGVGRDEGDAGQKRGGPFDGRPGDAGGRDHAVPGRGQRGTEHGAHPPGGDDPDGEPRGAGVHGPTPRISAFIANSSLVPVPRHERVPDDDGSEGSRARRGAPPRVTGLTGAAGDASRGAAAPSPAADGARRP